VRDHLAAQPRRFFEEGISAISHNLDWHTALWKNRTYLEPLLDPDSPFTRAALVLVALGLAAKDPTEQALAVDALETALVDGRTNGPALGAGSTGSCGSRSPRPCVLPRR